MAIGDRARARHGLDLDDRAIAEQIVPCGECVYCRNGRRWMCERQNIYGHQRGIADGGMAEYMRYGPRSTVYGVPRSIPPHLAAMIEPLSCSVHTVSRARIEFGDVVVVAGLGPIGLCKLQLARLRNPRLLIGIDMKPKRLKLAGELGADVVIDASAEDAVARVPALTGGYGCDVYIHNTGHPSGVTQGLRMIRKTGRFVEFSVFSAETSVDWSIIGDRKELDILGSHISGPDGYPVAIAMLDKGQIRVDGIVTHRLPLERYLEGLERAGRGDESVKVVLEP